MVIAVDFDGTIVENAYPAIGREVAFAIETLLLIQKELKHTLILWTVREGRELQEAIDFCANRGLRFYAANQNHPEPSSVGGPRKLMADLFIDDRNFGGMPDWGFIYSSLKNGDYNVFEASDQFHNANSKIKKKKSFFEGLFSLNSNI